MLRTAVQVAGPVRGRQVVVEDGVDGDRGAGDDVVDQFVGAADPGPALVEAAEVDHLADKAVLDDALLDPCPVRAVDEAGLVAGRGLADQGRLVEGGVGQGQLGRAAGPALGQVAVGVVGVGLAAGLAHRVRTGAAVDVGPDVRLGLQVAERVVGVGRGREGAAAGGGVDQGGGQAVEAVLVKLRVIVPAGITVVCTVSCGPVLRPAA